jgi:hypothetical protein
MTMQAEDDRLGQVAYDAYATQTGGKSLVSGDQLPPWADLDDSIQTAWIAAARTVLANASGLIATEVGSPPAEPEDEGDELEEPEAQSNA